MRETGPEKASAENGKAQQQATCSRAAEQPSSPRSGTEPRLVSHTRAPTTPNFGSNAEVQAGLATVCVLMFSNYAFLLSGMYACMNVRMRVYSCMSKCVLHSVCMCMRTYISIQLAHSSHCAPVGPRQLQTTSHCTFGCRTSSCGEKPRSEAPIQLS